MASHFRWFVPRWLSAARHARRLPKRSAARNQRKLLIETLETRAMLAHDITIAAGGSLTIPAGATSFSDTGDYTISPTAISAATANIVLEANTDVTINAAI